MGKRRGHTSLWGFLKEAGLQADTTARAFSNTSTFGAANPISAALNSIPALWQPERYGQAFNRNVAAEQARDAYDETHRPAAKRLGEAAAIIAALVRGQPPKLPGASPAYARSLTQGPQARLATTMAAGGAVHSAAQTAVNSANGQQTTPVQMALNAIPGLLGAVAASRGGAPFGGMVEGIASSVQQNLTSGAPFSVSEATQGGIAGSKLASAAELAALRRLDTLNIDEKRVLGEALSALQSPLRGDIPIAAQISFPVWGGSTRTDLSVFNPWRAYTGRNPFLLTEAKYGPSAQVRGRQAQAREEYGDSYIIDHFLNDEVARAGGTLASAFTTPFFDDRER